MPFNITDPIIKSIKQSIKNCKFITMKKKKHTSNIKKQKKPTGKSSDALMVSSHNMVHMFHPLCVILSFS